MESDETFKISDLVWVTGMPSEGIKVVAMGALS